MMHKNNQRGNAKRIKHEYKKGEKVLLKEDNMSKLGKNPYSGPYIIRKVNNNGTVLLKRGTVLEPINIRLLKPYKS